MRDISLDIMRLFAIIMVVVGHSIHYTIPDYDHNFVYKFIYAFHMPFFFILSGASLSLISTKKELNFNYYVSSKAVQLLIPFFSFALVSYLLYDRGNVFLWLGNILLSKIDNGLWFLIVLFQIFFIFYISTLIAKFIKQFVGITINHIYIYIFIVLLLPLSKVGGLHFVKYYAIFFIFGYLIYNMKFTKNMNKYLLFLMFIVYLLAIEFIWLRTGENYILVYLIKIPVAFLGSILFFGLFSKNFEIYKKVLDINFFQYINMNTLGIYAIHFYFISGFSIPLINYFNLNNMILILFLKSLIAIIMSLSIIWVIKKNKYLNFIFLGAR